MNSVTLGERIGGNGKPRHHSRSQDRCRVLLFSGTVAMRPFEKLQVNFGDLDLAQRAAPIQAHFAGDLAHSGRRSGLSFCGPASNRQVTNLPEEARSDWPGSNV